MHRILLFLSLFSLGFTSSNVQAGELADKLSRTKTIVFATEGNYPPFSFHAKDGSLTGYDIEVSKAVAAKLNLTAEFAETQWDAIFAGLNAKRFDVIGNQVGVSEERQQKYDFSTAYSVSLPVLIVRNDNEKIKEPKDLKGVQAAQTLTSNWNKLAIKYGANIVPVEAFSQGALLIINKRVDVAFNDKLAYLDFLQKSKYAPLKIAFELKDAAEKSAFAFRKNNADVVQKFNQALAELKKEGKLAEISKKWFGEDISE